MNTLICILRSPCGLALIIVLSTLLSAGTALTKEKKPPKWSTRNLLEIAWSPTLAVGELTTRDTMVTYKSLIAGYRFRIGDHSIGVRSKGLILSKQHDASAVTFSHGISAMWHYHWRPRSTMLMFFGLGSGAMQRDARHQQDTSFARDSQWYWTATPEIGFVTHFNRLPILVGTGADVGTHFTRAITANIYIYLGIALPH